MTAPLDEKAIEAAHIAYERYGQAGDLKTQRLPSGCIEAIVRAYLAASPSPSEMEVVEGLLSDGQPLVTLSSAQSALAAMRAERDAALDIDWVARPAFETAIAEAYGFRSRAEAAESQVLRLTEENEALRKERTSLIETKREQIGRLELSRGAASKIALDAIARAEAAEARIKALEEALRPFASVADALPEDQFANSYTPAGKDVLPSMRSFRLARTTLQKEQADG